MIVSPKLGSRTLARKSAQRGKSEARLDERKLVRHVKDLKRSIGTLEAMIMR